MLIGYLKFVYQETEKTKLERVLTIQRYNFTTLTTGHFIGLIDTFQNDTLETTETTGEKNDCNIFGEKNFFDRLIVMDDVSGLADKSDGLVSATFLAALLLFFLPKYKARSRTSSQNYIETLLWRFYLLITTRSYIFKL